MNITPHVNPMPLQTVVNPQTDNLRRENNLREVIAPVVAVNKSASEKAVASDRERAKPANQNGETVDFGKIQEQAEKDATTITENGEQQGQEKNSSSQQEHSEPQQGDASESEHDHNNSYDEKVQAQEVTELKQRDLEVRQHELAHATVGGAYTGSPSYSFEVGPDGQRYAVGGEVSVDLSPIDGDPRATISKMQKVHAAALAPADPSVQDTRVAAAAAQIILQAQSELSAQEHDRELPRNSTIYPQKNDVLRQGDSDGEDFDQLIERTLSSQEDLSQVYSPTISQKRTLEIDQRADRIEGFYLSINQAYEKPPSSNFTLSV